MKVKRGLIVAAAMALVLTVVLMGAVGAKVVSPLAINEQGLITNLHMSDSCEGDDISLFPADTETVYVVFDYSGMHGEEMRIAVTDGVELYNETNSYTDSGVECITVNVSGPIPPDTYRTQIWAGDYPIKTLLWHVRPGGPGEITELDMSVSPDGPPATEFIEGIRTLWAVFDYTGMEGNEVWVEVHGWYNPLVSSKVTLTGSATKAISVTHPWVTGFPADQYRTRIVRDGFVDAIEDWSVLFGLYLPLVLKNQP